MRPRTAERISRSFYVFMYSSMNSASPEIITVYKNKNDK